MQKSTAGKAHDVLPDVRDEWKAALRLRASKSRLFLERWPADGMPLPLT
jgi:hypothetical protein